MPRNTMRFALLLFHFIRNLSISNTLMGDVIRMALCALFIRISSHLLHIMRHQTMRNSNRKPNVTPLYMLSYNMATLWFESPIDSVHLSSGQKHLFCCNVSPSVSCSLDGFQSSGKCATVNEGLLLISFGNSLFHLFLILFSRSSFLCLCAWIVCRGSK